MHRLTAEGFSLSLKLDISESDIKYPSNTIMSVSVSSHEFSAASGMDIDIKEFGAFAVSLKSMYDELSGEAAIQEAYGYHRSIAFSADKSGHISVKGYLCDELKNHEFYFSNSFDQTFLRDFACELFDCYSKYASQNI